MTKPIEIKVDSSKLLNPVTSLVPDSNIEKNLFEYFKLYYMNIEEEPISRLSKDILNIIYSGSPPDNFGEIFNFHRPIEFINKIYKILSNIRIMILHQAETPNIVNVKFIRWEGEVAVYELELP